MTFRRAARTALAAGLPLVSALGCPVLLDDDFTRSRAETPSRDASADPGPDADVAASSGGGTSADAASAGGTSPFSVGDGGVVTGAGGATAVDSGTRSDGDAAACTPCGVWCCSDGWEPIAAPNDGFVAREKAAYVAFGTRVFVWGGADAAGAALRTGSIYDAASDGWTDVPVASATPTARVLATAVWTGTHLVVWGGGDATSLTDYATGALYDPVAGSWRAMSTTGAPSPRRAPHGIWTGSRVLFWGGTSAAAQPVGGAYLYDPVADTWTAAATTNEPVPPLNPTVGWTGSQLIVYGGRPGGTSYTGHTDAYDPALDTWTRVAAGPSGRQSAFGAWDSATFVVWGGTASAVQPNGQRLVPSTNRWTNVVATNAPSPRYAPYRETGWSARIRDTKSLLLGGYDKTHAALTDGGLYDSTTNTWVPVTAWPSSSAHLWGVGVWAGTHFVLFGGRDAPLGALTNDGERFAQ